MIRYLINAYFEYDKNIKININNEYLTYNCFYPLPTKLFINESEHNITENNNIYSIKNGCNKKILFANRILPCVNKDPIPFSFPIIKNNELEIINTNIYYYELTILESIMNIVDNETCCIGYGPLNIIMSSFIGNDNNSVGYHLNNGEIIYNKKIYDGGIICKTNDTVGAGLIYVSNNIYKPFFTYNGALLDIKLKNICNYDDGIIPLVEYNYSNKIKINFGQEEFKFDIEKFRHNCNILSQKNNFLKIDRKLSNINTLEIMKNHNKIIKLIMFTNDNAIINFENILQTLTIINNA
jgi:hypothetical protein